MKHSIIRRALFGIAISIATLTIAVSALAGTATGATPTDPLMVPTGDQTIAPQTTLWFYFDYATEKLGAGGSGGGPGGGPGGGAPASGAPAGAASTDAGGSAPFGTRIRANVTVDAGGASGLGFGLYTPAQGQEWIQDKTVEPVGRGTPYRDTSNGLVTHDLYWSGGFNTSGRYLVAVTNTSDTLVTFHMTVTGDSVTLYPQATATATPTLEIPISVTPVPTGTVSGKILFETETGGEIYTVNGDGTDLKVITHGIDPSWSPDGTQITFARWDNTNPGIFIANADGSNERLIYATPRARWPQWSPDGKYIVFSQDKTKDENKTLWRLGLIELATGKLTEPQCSDLSYTPFWGLDSTTVYYADPDRAIMATNIFKGPAWLVGPTATYFDTSANISRPLVNWPAIQDVSLSPDGQQLSFSIKAHDRWEVSTISVNGGPVNSVTKPDDRYYVLGQVIKNVSPTWSQDGKEILYLSDQNGKWEFFVTDPTGSETRQVLKDVTDQVAIKFGYENERIMDWIQ